MAIVLGPFPAPSSASQRLDLRSAQKDRLISPVVQNHLKLVYLTLCSALLASATGAYLHLLWNIGGFITSVLSLVALNFTLAISSRNKNKKFSLLLLSTLFEGASVGPLIQLAVEIDPRYSYL